MIIANNPAPNSRLALVSERWIAQIMCKPDCGKDSRYGASDPGIAPFSEGYLGFLHDSFPKRAVHDVSSDRTR